jgi:hypothetical protein
MAIARRSLGLGTLLLSVLGLTVCLAVIVGVWMVKSREELAQLRDTAVVSREVATRILARAVDLEGRMSRLATGIEQLDLRVSEIRTDVVDFRQRVPWWLTVAALLLTLLPTWFAVSQVVTAWQGWRLMRRVLDKRKVTGKSQGSQLDTLTGGAPCSWN